MSQGKTTIIQPNKPLGLLWKELYSYRDLFLILAWRDFKVRYKQTVVGASWAVVRPLLTMVIFTFVFGQIANLPSDGAPYSILVLTALLPWTFFSSTITAGSDSITSNAGMVSKIYFPRIILPISSLFVNLIDLVITFFILIIYMLLMNKVPNANILALPLFLLLVIFCSTGFNFWVSALNVRYRDFRYIIPFIVQLGLYVSPIGFSSSIIPEQWRYIYSLNPLVGIVDGFRWCLLDSTAPLYVPGVINSLVLSFALLLGGIWFFQKRERQFADII